MKGEFLERWWEGGRYGCQNDGLDEADTTGGKRGGEGGREDVPGVLPGETASVD